MRARMNCVNPVASRNQECYYKKYTTVARKYIISIYLYFILFFLTSITLGNTCEAIYYW